MLNIRRLSGIVALASTAALGAFMPSAFAQTPMANAVAASSTSDGIVKVRSVYPFDETIVRLRKDIADKGIVFFQAIDQTQLAGAAGITLPPSTLLVFGNPPLGVQFITANPSAGLDWPVRLLVHQDAQGGVWAVYTDFAWIARRHGIENRQAQFAMASSVVESITASIRKR